MQLYPHQLEGLGATEHLNKVAYYWDMGLGKTFIGAEKMHRLNAPKNLIICQKSKIDDWSEHIAVHYPQTTLWDLTRKKNILGFLSAPRVMGPDVGIINYDLAFRRPELATLTDFTLMLDESSLIQNERAKRSKFILSKLKPDNVILLSGTPTGGKYENLWSQMRLLGWDISKHTYWSHYVNTKVLLNQGFPITIVTGYKNVERLKDKMRHYGCQFLKTDEVFHLPEQTFQTIPIPTTKAYRTFRQHGIVDLNGVTIVGDGILSKMLYERMLCGHLNPDKLTATHDLLSSTEERVVIFYNFNAEYDELLKICDKLEKPVATINGTKKDLTPFEEKDNAVTLAQYRAGAMGHNLQKARRVIYFTPTLSSELYEQSKKRIHRIGQEQACFYYNLTCRNSVEEYIYRALEERKDYTEYLFEEDSREREIL